MPSELKVLLGLVNERREAELPLSKLPKKKHAKEKRKTAPPSLPDQLIQELLRWGDTLGKAAFISMLEEIPPLILCAGQLGVIKGQSSSRLSVELNAMEARFSAKVSLIALKSLFLESSLPRLLAAQSRSHRNKKAGEQNPHQEPFYKQKIREILSESSGYSQNVVIHKLVENHWIEQSSETEMWRVAEDESGRWRRREVKASSMESAISTIRSQLSGKSKKN
jgi:hypothetical protein